MITRESRSRAGRPIPTRTTPGCSSASGASAPRTPTTDAAFEEQLNAWRRSLAGGARRVGWKIGLNIEEVQRALGLREPVVGHLTSATQLQDGDSFDATGAAHLRAECEVALRMGDGAIDAHAVALELVDVTREPGGVAAIVAGNVFHRAFILGPVEEGPVPSSTGGELVVGAVVHEADQAPCDFDAAVRVVRKTLEAAGERLAASDWILSGSLVHVAVSPGDEVTARVEGLGEVGVRISGGSSDGG